MSRQVLCAYTNIKLGVWLWKNSRLAEQNGKGSEIIMEQGSLIIIALTFIVLTIGLLTILHIALKHWIKIQQTVAGLGMQVQATQAEIELILQPTKEAVDRINEQLKSSKKIFTAAEQTTDAVQQMTKAANYLSELLSTTTSRYVELTSHKKQKHIDESLQWAEIAVLAWQLWQNNRIRQAGVDLEGQETESEQVELDKQH
ncbi:DUF948 domain-containing protein [Paenibacillus yanchengensis]|uniref:DUF948 domain-containing protein n=1 Tax=Paenibacillus yanchengensis TaxID=2035833 RepID=A0ABW4YPA6_9BACL